MLLTIFRISSLFKVVGLAVVSLVVDSSVVVVSVVASVVVSAVAVVFSSVVAVSFPESPSLYPPTTSPTLLCLRGEVLICEVATRRGGFFRPFG